jgi:hypothetical protein
MGQVVQTNGDYTIKALPDDRTVGGRIVLDTGDNVGEVRVTGNLVVTGATLTVETANLNVQDNVIILNYGEVGAGVTLDYSGIQVDRGSLPAASFVYDETNGYWFLAAGAQPGPFSFLNDGTNPSSPRSASRIKLKEILTDSIADSGDLLLIGTGTGVLKVGDRGPGPGYETFVTDPDDVPNKQYVDNAIRDNPTFQILADGPDDPLNPLPNNATRVIVTDADIADLGNGVSSLDYFSQNTGESTGGESAVSILVDGVLSSQFYSDRVFVQELDFSDNQITINREDTFNDTNIVITIPGTGKLQTNHALQLDNWNVTPSYASNATMIYSKTPEIGTTGLFFTHSARSGEFISKNKALVFSMIF